MQYLFYFCPYILLIQKLIICATDSILADKIPILLDQAFPLRQQMERKVNKCRKLSQNFLGTLKNLSEKDFRILEKKHGQKGPQKYSQTKCILWRYYNGHVKILQERVNLLEI